MGVNLEQQKNWLEIKKLRAEINELETRKSTPAKTKVPLIALLTLLLGYLSFTLPFDLQQKNQKNQTFIKLVEQATTAETPEGRIAGIWMLNSYWDNDDSFNSKESWINKIINFFNSNEEESAFYEPIANTLSGIVTSDNNYFVRLAAAEVIGNAYQGDWRDNKLGVKNKLETRERVESLRLLLYGDGTTGINGTLTWANQRLKKSCIQEAVISQQQKCLEKLDATKEAIRKNWENLENANLNETDLSDSSFEQANLKRANLARAKLQGINLRDANLIRVNLIDADLTEADLRGSKFNQAVYNQKTTFKDVKWSDNIQNPQQNMYLIEPGANLTNADLSELPLQGANLNNANLTNADLSRSNLSRANLSNANLTNANLTNAILKDTKYNQQTTFPHGFNPKLVEMIEVK